MSKLEVFSGNSDDTRLWGVKPPSAYSSLAAMRVEIVTGRSGEPGIAGP
jgi:hypothetical protein